MDTIIEYVAQRTDVMISDSFSASSFSASCFSSVDSLVLSQLSYIQFDGMVKNIDENDALPIKIGDLLKAERFPTMMCNVRDSLSNKKLLYVLAGSPRFRDIKMLYYVNQVDSVAEKQFSATTFLLQDGTAYIAFRGTDTSFIGWKEDLNMAFICPIPSQEAALKYLNQVGELLALQNINKLRIGGHSKGGNLAVYSAMKCKSAIRDNIIDIYSHDGPGFMEETFKSSDFLDIQSRIHKTIPPSSMVGMLLECHESYSAVQSKRLGIMQHDPFSWIIKDNDFVYTNLSTSVERKNQNINKWLSTLSNEKRKQFIDTLYQVINAMDSKNFTEFSKNWLTEITRMLDAYDNIDSETKKFLYSTMRQLFAMSMATHSKRSIAPPKIAKNGFSLKTTHSQKQKNQKHLIN